MWAYPARGGRGTSHPIWGGELREAHQAMAHPCQIVVRNATNVSAHLFRQVMWGSMWRLTRLHGIPRNSQIQDWRNATNAMWVYRQAIWVGTWKSSLGPPRKHLVVQGIMFYLLFQKQPKDLSRTREGSSQIPTVQLSNHWLPSSPKVISSTDGSK